MREREREVYEKRMRLQKTCLPYMVIVAVVMSIYSMFLVHLTQSFRSSLSAEVSDYGVRCCRVRRLNASLARLANNFSRVSEGVCFKFGSRARLQEGSERLFFHVARLR